MSPILQDLRYALRMLRKNFALTAVIVLSLALGIGANTAIFSVVNALMLKPLPYPQPDRLAILWLRSPGIGIPQDWPSPGQYMDIKNENHSFDELSISIGGSMNLTGQDRPERMQVIKTSSTLLDMLGAKPLLGRTFLPEEDKPGKAPVALLTHGAWKRLFGGDPQIVGRSLTLNGNQITVAGVLSPDFLLNNEVLPTVAGLERVDLLLPLPFGADAVNRRGDENYNIVARLKPGVTMRSAQEDVAAIAARIRVKDKRDRTFTISVVPLLDQVVGNVRRSVLVMLGAVTLVLLIACANVANLLLSRATGREKEVAIRAALGAGRIRLMRQLLTESVLLGLLGGAAGLLVAGLTLFIVRDINPGNIPRLEAIRIDGSVLAFTFGVGILTGILFGMAPAIRVARVDLNTSLKSGGRSSQTAGGFNVARQGLRSVLVVAELALSMVLLIGAGLLMRSFAQLASVPPGFNPDHVISLRSAENGPKYSQDKARVQYYRDIGERISHLPGVVSQGAISALPLTASVGWGGITIEGYTPPPSEPELQVDLRTATNDYFRTMEIPLKQGRFFNDHDTADVPPVVAIDEKMARRFWPNESAIGKRMRNGPKSPWLTVVGVVGTVKQYGLDIDGRMVVYYPEQQAADGALYIVARTTGDPASVASAMIREIHSVDPGIPVIEVRTMQERLHDSLARQRFSMVVLGGFAGFALLLAAVGIYGVISYMVTQGMHDLGLRMALGAQRQDILGLVVRQGLTLTGAGIFAGLIGAFTLTRVMASLLFNVSATDVATFSSVTVFLVVIALLASYVPALRATRVDPVIALHYE
ncbi:MAG TPA: ABC transporter permease [Bryobacteraceae bacterium]|nr:ABC transporter permease [Bryobacteraceae bacterium]